MRYFIAFSLLVPFVAAAAPVTLVAPTDKLSPEQELATFKLPPGYVAQLVAAEPDIAKPMNIAFDDRGRLWVTSTVEYPWPAEPGKGRDTVKILSDFGPDGRARKVTTFIEGLNIPLGVLPMTDPDGSTGAIVYSIPEIRRYHDTDGDGKADKSEKLLGDFGTVDTHGMTNNFVRGYDGYIYANHGFRNDSTVVGTDGSKIVMNSGNTYRFKPDGSNVQIWARGQVNPFGLAFDEWGNLFSADCHTRPQYLLLRGAVYPSFGKPDDGLGFGPEMCTHLHGSTGIAGTMVYAAEQFPAEYRGDLFNGNPVTNTVNRDKLKWFGSTPQAVEQPDFLVSSDPWFRPVQVKLGPDGAMYVADFYNKIIGHYEVDLKHPGRDRTSGRIWRIVYQGDAKTPPPPAMLDMSKLSPEDLVKLLGDPNLTVRMLATDRLADGDPAKYEKVVRQAYRSFDKGTLAMWVLLRWGKLTPEDLTDRLLDESPMYNRHVHNYLMLAERESLSAEERKALVRVMDDPSVQRAAAQAAAAHPDEEWVEWLLSPTDRRDTHLAHAKKIALREQLRHTPYLANVKLEFLTVKERLQLLEAAIGVDSPAAGAFITACVTEMDLPPALGARVIQHGTRIAADDEAIGKLAASIQVRYAGDLDLQLQAMESIHAGVTARGGVLPSSVRMWGEQLLPRIFSSASGDGASEWTRHPSNAASDDPWTPQSRKCSDGKTADFWSSLPRGETLTGVLRSKPFAAPEKLSLWIAGHNGLLSLKEPAKNVVRLVDAATGDVLAEAPASRNDVAQQVTWDLAKVAGRQVAIEAVDADDRTAYAWIAFGRLEPAVVPIPADNAGQVKRMTSAIDLAAAMKLTSATPKVKELIADGDAEPAVRLSAAKALAAIDPSGAVAPIAGVLNDAAVPTPLRAGFGLVLGSVREPSAVETMSTALAAAPQELQRVLALAMAGSKDGGEALLASVAAGKASPRLLADKPVQDKLRAAGVAELEQRIATLTRGMPDIDAAMQKLIDDRRKAVARGNADAAAIERGRAVFAANCAACHRIGNEGALIGPQLDGLGKRGVDRMVEDILDPSRNVDGAFRYSILTLDDGDVVTGLQRRIDGQTIVFADAQGKEFTLQASRIVKRTESNLSLMPANFGELLEEKAFGDLMAFLLSR